MSGFIQLHRKMIKWEWYTDLPTKSLFLHCLFMANYTDKVWRGIEIKAGSFITSLDSLSKETGLSVQQARTSLKKLELTSELTNQSTNRFRLITIVNYSKFQNESTSQSTSKQQANNKPANKQITTTNKDNKFKKEKNIEERKDAFLVKVKTEWKKLGEQNYLPTDEAKGFFDYWAEHGDNDIKMRFEKEKTFGITRRLSTWKKNYLERKPAVNNNWRPNY